MSADDKPRLDGMTIEELQENARHGGMLMDDSESIRFVIVNDPILHTYLLHRYGMDVDDLATRDALARRRSGRA